MGPLEEMAVGVTVNNEDAIRVMTSETTAMLVDSLLLLLFHLYKLCRSHRKVYCKAERYYLFSLKISCIFLNEVVTIFIVRPTRASRCSINSR